MRKLHVDIKSITPDCRRRTEKTHRVAPVNSSVQFSFAEDQGKLQSKSSLFVLVHFNSEFSRGQKRHL